MNLRLQSGKKSDADLGGNTYTSYANTRTNL